MFFFYARYKTILCSTVHKFNFTIMSSLCLVNFRLAFFIFSWKNQGFFLLHLHFTVKLMQSLTNFGVSLFKSAAATAYFRLFKYILGLFRVFFQFFSSALRVKLLTHPHMGKLTFFETPPPVLVPVGWNDLFQIILKFLKSS